jgi:hypothetical protein
MPTYLKCFMESQYCALNDDLTHVCRFSSQSHDTDVTVNSQHGYKLHDPSLSISFLRVMHVDYMLALRENYLSLCDAA